MLNKSKSTVIIAFILSLFFTSLAGAVPHEMNYQGKVVGADGILLDGNYDMTFSIYNDPIDGNRLWNEQQNVPINDGIFNVSLGAVVSLSEAIFTASFLGIEVAVYNTDSATWEILTPRQRLTSTAYAFQAENAQTIGGYGSTYFAPVGHKHSGEDTTSGTVDEARIDPDIARDSEVTWANLPDIPAGFADGIDNEGTGTAEEVDPTVLPSVKDGVSWGEIGGMPAGFFDGVDNEGIATEVDPQVGSILQGYLPYWSGSSLITSGVFGDKTMTGTPLWDTYWKIGIGTTDPAASLDVVTDAGSNIAIHGKNSASNHFGRLGTDTYGAIGQNADGTYGILGWGFGVFGYNSSSANQGALAGVLEGAMGKHNGSSNYGQLGRIDYGTYGYHNSSGNWGALGAVGTGVEGRTTSTNEWHTAVYGRNEGQGAGVYGWSQNHHGTVGVTLSTNSNDAGVWAVNNGTGPGLIATAGSEGYAAKFLGQVSVDVLEIKGADLSEQYNVRNTYSSMLPTPGQVVSIDPENPGDLLVSHAAYDRKVAGIISGAGDISIGMLMGKEGHGPDGKNPIALTGRVYCLADASDGPIFPGDLLTTSNTPGHAMKVADYPKAQGAILGKAMSELDAGRGLVLVLVSLQ